MGTHEYTLASPPKEERAHELWIQHAAGFILFEDIRGYARDQLDPELPPDVKAVAEKAIDDAVYGLMMVMDGVTGGLANTEHQVDLKFSVRRRRASDPQQIDYELDLGSDGDGMCMGYHMWKEGDFGDDPVTEK